MENLIDNINNQCCVCLNIIDVNEKCFLKCSHFLCNSCIDSANCASNSINPYLFNNNGSF